VNGVPCKAALVAKSSPTSPAGSAGRGQRAIANWALAIHSAPVPTHGSPISRVARPSISPQLLNRPNPHRSSPGRLLSRFHSRAFSRFSRGRFHLLAAIPLQRWPGHGESLQRLRGGLHQRHENLHAAARGRHGRRRYRSCLSYGKQFTFSCPLRLSAYSGSRDARKSIPIESTLCHLKRLFPFSSRSSVYARAWGSRAKREGQRASNRGANLLIFFVKSLFRIDSLENDFRTLERLRLRRFSRSSCFVTIEYLYALHSSLQPPLSWIYRVLALTLLD